MMNNVPLSGPGDQSGAGAGPNEASGDDRFNLAEKVFQGVGTKKLALGIVRCQSIVYKR
jgi:hypothetical protein